MALAGPSLASVKPEPSATSATATAPDLLPARLWLDSRPACLKSGLQPVHPLHRVLNESFTLWTLSLVLVR